jgi:hypothetical protein
LLKFPAHIDLCGEFSVGVFYALKSTPNMYKHMWTGEDNHVLYDTAAAVQAPINMEDIIPSGVKEDFSFQAQSFCLKHVLGQSAV